MAFTFENQGTNTYLVYKVGENDTMDSMSLGMLTNNSIPGLAQTVFTQKDSEKFIKYNISSKISAKQLFSGAINKKRLLGIFSGIVEAMLSAEEYMIDTNTIQLDLEYIYADVTTSETVLICIPVQNKKKEESLGVFFKNILFSTRFDQTENCDYIAKMMNYLNSTPVLVLDDFKKILDNLKKENGLVQQTGNQVQTQYVNQQPVNSNMQYASTPYTQPALNPSLQPPVNSAPQQFSRQSMPPKAAAPAAKMPMPAQAPAAKAPAKAPAPAVPGEPEITFMYLMQHYNKDNAAKYKAQKEAKKANQNANKNVQQKPEKANKKQAKAAAQQSPNVGFAIPGQAVPVNAAAPVAPKPGQPAGQTAYQPKSGQPAGQTAYQPKAPYQQPQPGFQPQPAAAYQPKAPYQQGNAQQAFAQPQAAAYQAQAPYQQPMQPGFQPQPMPQAGAVSFGETTVLGGGSIGETTVLNAAVPGRAVVPYLVRLKNNEKIPVNKEMYRIGTERSYVDYFISDNSAVSRSHANVITRNGEYFIVDTNSTNHTYVNAVMIQSNSEVKLKDGDKIRLANEEFDFRIY